MTLKVMSVMLVSLALFGGPTPDVVAQYGGDEVGEGNEVGEEYESADEAAPGDEEEDASHDYRTAVTSRCSTHSAGSVADPTRWVDCDCYEVTADASSPSTGVDITHCDSHHGWWLQGFWIYPFTFDCTTTQIQQCEDWCDDESACYRDE